jgi:hypothetical protein
VHFEEAPSTSFGWRGPFTLSISLVLPGVSDEERSENMELTWELDSLYPSFQSEKYRQDRKLLAEYAEHLNQWVTGHLQNRIQNERDSAKRSSNF